MNSSDSTLQKAASTAVVVHEYAPEDRRAGFEGTSSADYKIPFINLLQALSPEVSDATKKLAGAQPGMFLNSVTKRLATSEEGVYFVPCAREHVVMEWKPRKAGGGLVGRHAVDSDLVRLSRAEAQKKAQASGDKADAWDWKTPAGNDLVDTFYLYGLLLPDAESNEPVGFAVISCSSTKIRKYQEIMTRMDTRRGAPPLYSNRLHITAIPDRNAAGQSFFNLSFKFAVRDDENASAIPPTLDGNVHPIIAAGRAMKQMVVSGEAAKRVEFEQAGHAKAAAENPDDDAVFGAAKTTN